MNATRNEEEIFLLALEITSCSQRVAYLGEACGENVELRRRVERLLLRHQESHGVLDAPPPGLDVTGPRDAGGAMPGAVIGPYKLLEQIGEGGFGVVFMAEQERPVRRRVALKIIKPGMDTRQVIARFEAERQALAMMDHTNIAKVLDAGATVDLSLREREGSSRSEMATLGRPYFVMELVQGVPITEYCDQCNLTTSERLELLITVCQAVQHAHQKGIIHRDIKPTNVLVAMQDGQPVPKIIDFGVAKAIGQRLTEQTLTTAFAPMVGTPLYMSPEQAELSPLGVDTRSDIYSLGALLYELLSGTTPLESKRIHDLPYDELRRIIREEEPPRPSARISTLAAEVATTIAEQRRTDARRLMHSVRGDLDWIVMKCLEKDRNRRYETANDLAMDIARCLRNEAISACSPSTWYRLHKFVGRHRGLAIAASIIAVVLVAGIAASVSQAMRASRAESLAVARLEEAIDMRASAERHAQAARHAVDDMYTQVAEKWLSHQPHLVPIQREFLEKALRYYIQFAEEAGAEADVRLETALAYRRIADIQHRLGQVTQAEQAYTRAVDHFQSLAADVPNQAEYRAELAATLNQWGVLLGDTGRSAEAERIHRRALALNELLQTELLDADACRRIVARGHWYVGQALLAMQHREEAVIELQAALAIQRDLVHQSPENSEYRFDLAQTYLRLGLAWRYLGHSEEYDQALTSAAKLLESLVADFPMLPKYRNELASAYYWHVGYFQANGGDREESEKFLRRAITLQQRLADDFPSVTNYRYDLFRSQKTLGRELTAAGRFDEAETALRQAAAVADQLIASAPSVHYYRGGRAYVHLAMGDLYAQRGRRDAAESEYRAAIRLLETLSASVPVVPQYPRYLRAARGKLEAELSAFGRTQGAAEPRLDAFPDQPTNRDTRNTGATDEISLNETVDGDELDATNSFPYTGTTE